MRDSADPYVRVNVGLRGTGEIRCAAVASPSAIP